MTSGNFDSSSLAAAPPAPAQQGCRASASACIVRNAGMPEGGKSTGYPQQVAARDALSCRAGVRVVLYGATFRVSARRRSPISWAPQNVAAGERGARMRARSARRKAGRGRAAR